MPGSPVDLSLIPATFEMETFNQLARTVWEIRPEDKKSMRWVVAPRLIIYTRVLDCSTSPPENIGFFPEEVPEGEIAGAIAAMRAALDVFSGGMFPDFSEVIRVRGEPGERRILRHAPWDHAIHGGACRSLAQWGQEVDGGAAVLHKDGPFVVTGGVALWRANLSPVRREQVQMHEFGHTLGLSHTFTRVPSIMSYTAPTHGLSWFDRQAGRVLYQRPPGNSAPDIDPVGFVVNGAAGSLPSLSTQKALSVPAAAWMCRLHTGK